MSTRPHGYARYRLDGCRCYVCAFARSQYDDNRKRAIAYGTWQPWVDAGPVRTHIRHLQDCGMGLRAIAAAADVDRKRLQAIVTGRTERGTGPQEKARPELAAAVLAVEPTLENLAPATLIDPTGTRRRVQALVAAGWPQQHLAAHLGMTAGNFGAMLARDNVLARRAVAVRAMYDALWRADPADHGATAAGITRARKHAAANGWAPVGAWDDDTIDDPAAEPWTASELKLSRDDLAAIRRDEIEHLDGCGLSEHEIAGRLGMGLTTVANIVRELHTGQRRIRPPEGAAANPYLGAGTRAPWTEPKCGEPRMYRRHLKNGETPCQKCRDANAAADRRYRLTGSRNAA